MGCLANAYFYISLGYNVVLQRLIKIPWYNRVDDVVILGALPFRSYNHELVNEGVKGVVTALEPHETKYWFNTKEEWRSIGIEQLVLSTPDWFSVPSDQQIKEGVDFILKFKDRKPPKSVYVHCKAGRSRSATIVACYLINIHNYTPEEAVNKLREIRPRVRILPRHMNAIERYHKNYIISPITNSIKNLMKE
ncbi:hypothetical protein HELRODRAFT_70925 [Helobdella robusta]|uniref:Phosphatidylglycerophosphatase and protein-tyrosine phosphatase 1 n=1 Tax=Helobdella robusta TaxID=6412 RepID=T1G0E4_HELRO|nr:hypothetical protein HELRODRAFT_70925 [Helobdella robusta]ESN90425.1 hypothetical protein HELRODRAFT_70925 [Helobdella robusta]